MAGKLIIRRMGSVAPTVCLLFLLACCIAVAWLSTQGVPDFAVRFLEHKAAQQGVYLRVDKLRLAPMRGLAVRASDVRLYADAKQSKMLGHVRHAAAGLSLGALLTGNLRMSFIQIVQANFDFPVTTPAEAKLPVLAERVELHMGRRGVLHIDNGRLDVMGVPVKLSGSLDPAALPTDSSSDEPLNMPKLITEHQDAINRVYTTIHNQQWTQEEVPALSIRVDWVKQPHIALQANIPRYDIGQFHFRDAVADLNYNTRNITINSLRFRTKDPEASASFQGGYDMEERHLGFNMRSTAALVRMIHHVSHPKTRAFLEKFRHPDDTPPDIKLSGDIVFEEDFTLKSARVRGHVLQQSLMVGSTKVNELELSFFYNNGDFNIDKFELRFPDGSLQALANAKNRVGQAQLVVDLPIQKVLNLVNEFSPEPLQLPTGLTLGERVNLQLQAQLDAPSFKPGQDTWQDFVPTFHMLGAWLTTDKIAYNGYRLDRPRLQIKLSEIKQKASYMPDAVQQVQLTLQAQGAELPAALSEQPLRFVSPSINADFGMLRFNGDGLPNSAEGVGLSAMAKEVSNSAAGADNQHETDFRIQAPQLDITARQVNLESYENPDALSVQQARVGLKLEGMQMGKLQVGNGDMLVDELRQITPLGNPNRLFSNGQLKASFHDVKYDTHEMGEITLNAGLNEYTNGYAGLHVLAPGGRQACAISAKPDWSNPRQIVLEDVQVQMPGKFISMLLNITGVEVNEVEVPELVSMGGKLLLSPEMQLQEAALRMEIPELVRTPQRVVVFRGMRIPLSLAADVALQREHRKKDLFYNINLKATHATGDFVGRVTGSTAGNLRVTGLNTIRPDVLDQLIDNARAHSIIRDFRFSNASKATISDINVQVDYTNGVQVDSFCRVELNHAEYQMSVLLENADGTERVRTDIGPDPYTMVNLATCGVSAHVRVGCMTPQGVPLPDEAVVTISDPTLLYNNSPWLRRNKWKAGVRETKLSGEAVIIDVEHSFVELRKVGGSVYPAYSLGMFYPELYGFLKDVVLPLPALVETDQCVFPIYDDCVRPMSGVISVKSRKNAGFHFIGTTIPLDDFSGFISLSDDAVLLDRMNALSWDGVINAMVRIGIGSSKTTFDGIVRAGCMNMQKIAHAYNSVQSPALCSGEIRFRSPSSELQDVTAYGRVDIEDGDLMSLSLFHPVGEMVSDLPKHLQHLERQARGDQSPKSNPGFFMRLFSGIFRGLGKIVGRTGGEITNTASNIPGMNHLIAYDLKEAHADFQIANGHIFTHNMKAIGSNLNVKLYADIDLDTLQVHGNLWPKISSLPTLLLAPVTFLSNFVMDIVIYGPLDDIKWRIDLDRSMKRKNGKENHHKNGQQPTSPVSIPAEASGH